LEVAVRFAVLASVFSICTLVLGAAEAEPLDHLFVKDDIGQNKIPNQGTSAVLVIPVSVGPEGFPAAQFTSLQQQFDPAGGPGTFRQYWQDVSLGAYDPVPTLMQPVEYLDSCPFPPWTGKTVDDCQFKFDIDELDLVLGGGVAEALIDILTRLRDEQSVDFGDFDINTGDGPGSDGFFDGVIIMSDLAEVGVAPPLEPLFNETIIASQPGGVGPMIELGQVAMAPPINHEFAHLFGFMDLYRGPTVAGLMGNATSGALCAFSRQQIEWGTVETISDFGTVEMPPVLETGKVFRVGAPGPQYLLIENRNGPLHTEHEVIDPGVYVHAIDETVVTPGPLHFFDIMAGDLYFPNQLPPYLTITMPVDCEADSPSADACALDQLGERRNLEHQNGTRYGMGIEVVEVRDDGTIVVDFYDSLALPGQGGGGQGGGGTSDAPAGDDGGCGCSVVATGDERLATLLWFGLGLGLAWRCRRRGRRR